MFPIRRPIVQTINHKFALPFCSGTCVNSLSLWIADFKLSKTNISMSRWKTSVVIHSQ